jgi:AcrR family transcriptional regulator
MYRARFEPQDLGPASDLTGAARFGILVHYMNVDSSKAKPAQKLRDRFREETSRAVLRAAEEVFAEDGLHAASMSKIAERAGVAVGTLYNHFQDRQALLEALVDEQQRELLDTLDRSRADLAARPFRAQLEGLLQALFRHFELHGAFLRIALSSESGGLKKGEEMPRALSQRIEALLKVGHREKVLRADPHRQFAVMLLGSVRATFLREKYGLSALDSTRAVEAITDFFCRGAGR